VEQFKIALRAFLTECCQQLSQTPTRSRVWTRVVREKGHMSFPQEMRPDFFTKLIYFRAGPIKSKIPTFSPVVEIIREDPQLRSILLVDAGGKPITDEKSQVSWLDNILTGPLLRTYIDKAKGFKFSEQVFDQLFKELHREIVSPDVTFTELSPLMNVEIRSDQIQIDSSMRLRQLSTDELEEWLNVETLLSSPPLSIDELIGLQSAVEVIYQQKRHSAFGSKNAREKVGRLMTAMRLLTDASPRLAFTEIRPSSLLTFGRATSWAASILRYGHRVTVDKSQESELIDLYKKLGSGPNVTSVKLALARWDSAADRLTEEDMLIDYWVALESLFVPDTTQELRYRTALRIAAYLGTNGMERNQIYEQMKESYSLRSEIVHGHIGKQKRKIGSAELINLSRSYLRKALLKILESSHHFDPERLESELLEKE
jgi:hypothetical protein